MQDFRALRVWQHARTVAREIYRCTRAFPADERFGLVAQMRRAAISICANIAEGCGRMTRRDLLRFLYIAEGSACELECEVLLSGDLGYLELELCSDLASSIIRGKRMLGALIRRVSCAEATTARSTDDRSPMTEDGVRLDKWLWAARFFKTRAAAAQAIAAGRVEVNGVPAKPARPLAVGDRLRVRRPPFAYLIRVVALSAQRGSAKVAAGLYEEDPEGKAARERLAHQLRLAPTPAYEGKGRPTKRDRRELERLRGDEPE